MFTFTRWYGEMNPPKGHWMPAKDEREGAICTCPKCGDSYGLALRDVIIPERGIRSTHRVADDGKVNPSVVCNGNRETGAACTFHDYVFLEGWPERHKPKA